MRDQYSIALKQQFWCQLVWERQRLNLTQAQMARILAMNERSYIELDHGHSCCGALTLVRFLLYCCEDTQAFLEDVKAALEREGEEIACER